MARWVNVSIGDIRATKVYGSVDADELYQNAEIDRPPFLFYLDEKEDGTVTINVDCVTANSFEARCWSPIRPREFKIRTHKKGEGILLEDAIQCFEGSLRARIGTTDSCILVDGYNVPVRDLSIERRLRTAYRKAKMLEPFFTTYGNYLFLIEDHLVFTWLHLPGTFPVGPHPILAELRRKIGTPPLLKGGYAYVDLRTYFLEDLLL